jgi:hypothetical protein
MDPPRNLFLRARLQTFPVVLDISHDSTFMCTHPHANHPHMLFVFARPHHILIVVLRLLTTTTDSSSPHLITRIQLRVRHARCQCGGEPPVITTTTTIITRLRPTHHHRLLLSLDFKRGPLLSALKLAGAMSFGCGATTRVFQCPFTRLQTAR